MAAHPPSDFALRYEWRGASVPPPHHYEYTIRVGPGAEGELVFWPGYPQDGAPAWTEGLVVTGEALAGLYRVAQETRVFTRAWRRQRRRPVGDSYDWLQATAGGTTVCLPAHLATAGAAAIAPLYEAIRALVPDALWARLRAEREAFIQAYEEERGR